MVQRRVVTCFLRHGDRILVLRRSARVSTYQGRWAGVSGSIEGGTSPREQALRELQEETGLAPHQVELLREAEPLVVEDPQAGVTWLVHPFLFAVQDPAKIRLDWEHTEARWVEPDELERLETVPKLKETWEQLWKRSPEG
ncbi:MAG: NUDIX domain-containing protein [Dehalococcoidia bacterium]